MTALTLGEAARLTGFGKTTLARAIKAGRLTAERKDDGSYRIDPAELHRVFPFNATPETCSSDSDVVHRATPEATLGDTSRDPRETVEIMTKLAALEAELEGLREILRRADQATEEARSERDAWRAQAESAQRLIADQRPRPWWRRMVG